jgi:hypothetical protein
MPVCEHAPDAVPELNRPFGNAVRLIEKPAQFTHAGVWQARHR